ncbi:MAG TPA: acyl-CoA dehydrogenase family protein [Gemmatimonadales bacterium]|nr:acyl-CoA dehydrogenase family protein [Gemmatimonadales bacterium]
MPPALAAVPGRDDREDLAAVARRIADDVAAPAAADVDARARFPHETIAALREARLLGALVPPALGGRGATLAGIAAVCEILGERCASSAMVFAMHQIEVACLVRHGLANAALREQVREVATHQLLLASATTEASVGGDVRTSRCAVERDGERFRLVKSAPVISYAEQADGMLVTARRAPDAAPNDQVLVLVRRGQCALHPTSGWDTLGFRGTCSLGWRLEAEGPGDWILPAPYADIAARTMVPTSHLLWASLWVGIATAALRRARAHVRAEARRRPDEVPPGALRTAELLGRHQALRATVQEALREYERLADDPETLSAMPFALRMNGLKTTASDLLVEIVLGALRVTGLAGYRRDSAVSVERHVRDALGAGLMIGNDRILGASAAMLRVSRDD